MPRGSVVLNLRYYQFSPLTVYCYTTPLLFVTTRLSSSSKHAPSARSTISLSTSRDFTEPPQLHLAQVGPETSIKLTIICIHHSEYLRSPPHVSESPINRVRYLRAERVMTEHKISGFSAARSRQLQERGCKIQETRSIRRPIDASGLRQ